MLEIEQLSVWYPGRGTVLDGLSCAVEQGVTAVVGRTGAGATTLLRAIAGRLPSGCRTRGRIRLDSQPITVPDDHPGLTIVPADALTGAPDTGLLLVDGAPTDRAALLAELRRRAAHCCILWATHDLDGALAVADRILELGGDGVVDAPRWCPRTLPEPTITALARLLGLPEASCRSAEDVALARRVAGTPLPQLPSAPRPGALTTARATRLTAAQLGLTGDDLLVPGDETLGVLDRGGNLPRPTLPWPRVRLSGRTPLHALRRLRRTAGVDPDDTLRLAGTLAAVRPRDPLRSHAPGELAVLRAAALATVPGPAWAVEPQRGLDPRARADLARRLRDTPQLRVVVSNDAEFLVRAARTVVVADDGVAVAVGTPSAVAHHLRPQPLVAAALGSPHYLRLGDVVAARSGGAR